MPYRTFPVSKEVDKQRTMQRKYDQDCMDEFADFLQGLAGLSVKDAATQVYMIIERYPERLHGKMVLMLLTRVVF